MPYTIVRTSRLNNNDITEHTLDAAVRRIMAYGTFRTDVVVRRMLLEGAIMETPAAYYHLKDDTE